MIAALASLPALPFAAAPTPVEELSRLRTALGGGPRLLIKRDDVIGFGFGGNKVRKIRFVAAEAQQCGADTLVTSGGIQSNHARVTAAAAAWLGMHCVLIANGAPPPVPTGNARLARLLGAEVRYVETRQQRAAAVETADAELRDAGRRPYVIPVGASTPLGAASYVLAVGELLSQIAPPDIIIHASSSGGTQAGLVAGCALHGLSTRVFGISADENTLDLTATVRRILQGIPALAGGGSAHALADVPVIVDDSFVGGGYGVPTDASREAIDLTARTEGIFLDPTYTAKAMAAVFAALRQGWFDAKATVLFWHTGGQVALFA